MLAPDRPIPRVTGLRVHLISRWTSAPAMEDWQRFGAGRFRWYHLLALSQGIVAVMTGFDVLIPFALAIGFPPALTPLLGMLSLAGGMAPLLLPNLLKRADGNLRLLTIALSALGETRGVFLALLVILLAAGSLTALPVMLFVVVIVGMSGVLSSMVSTNLLSWHSAVLPEHERRLVVPRLMSISLAVGALLLLPTALLMDSLVERFGLIIYAVPFGIAGAFGVVEIFVQSRLPRPGRVRVPESALTADAPPPPGMSAFVRSSVVNAVGMGIAPYTSVYAIVVLGLTPGFTMGMGAISLLTQVAASAWAGSRLTRGSSTRMLRSSFGIRALAMALPIVALPGLLIAPALLIASVMLRGDRLRQRHPVGQREAVPDDQRSGRPAPVRAIYGGDGRRDDGRAAGQHGRDRGRRAVRVCLVCRAVWRVDRPARPRSPHRCARAADGPGR